LWYFLATCLIIPFGVFVASQLLDQREGESPLAWGITLTSFTRRHRVESYRSNNKNPL
jgi:hypothetical protein